MTATLSATVKYRLTSSQYHRMIEGGILAEGDRLELIRGEIIDMSPIGRKHNACIARLAEAFFTKLYSKAIVWVQSSIHLDDGSEPQPDLVLLKPRSDFYEGGTPTPRDTLLIVEVSDSSISYDRDVKMPLYAEARLCEFWLVDLNDRTLVSYTVPAPDGYAIARRYRSGESIPIQSFPEVAIAWSDIFGDN
jgi:Uma2 family endonuclease